MRKFIRMHGKRRKNNFQTNSIRMLETGSRKNVRSAQNRSKQIILSYVVINYWKFYVYVFVQSRVGLVAK